MSMVDASFIECCAGVGHELEQDDVYEGDLLPKGSFVIPLKWSESLPVSFYHE